MFTAVTIIILIICAMLALVVLAQNPKGGGLAAGFTGAQQIGGVQRTADFLEKATWTLSGALMVLCLVSAGLQQDSGRSNNNLDDTIDATEVTTEESAPPVDENTNGTEEPVAGGDQ